MNDEDGFVRRSMVTYDFHDKPLFSFPIVVLSKYLDLGQTQLVRDRDHMVLGSFAIPCEPFYINFAGPKGTFNSIPYYQVARGGVPPDLFDNKIVLVGATYLGAPDAFPTPFFNDILTNRKAKMPGVEILANAISTILNQDYIHRCGWLGGTLILLMLGMGTTFMVASSDPVKSFAAMVGGMIVFIFLAFFAFAQFQLWIPVVIPVFTVFATYLVVIVFRYTTEKNRMIADLTEMKNYSDNMIESMDDGLIAVDLEGNVTVFNRASADITGLSKALVQGRDVASILPEGSDLRNVLASPLSGERREVTFTTTAGKQRMVEIKTSTMHDHRGEKTGLLHILRDLTLVKELQKQLQLRERLAAIGEVSAGVAHEIKNPLNSIRLMGELLRKKLSDNISVREHTAILLSGVKELTALMEDFLLFARPAAIQTRKADMNALLQDVTSFMEVEAQQRGIDFALDLCADVSPVDVDAEKFKWQVVVNLIKNAFEAMPDGGTLTIRTSLRERKEGDERSSALIIDIIDTGRGIPSDISDRIFDPFFSTKERGAGLGLAIAYKAVESHGGSISFTSAEGEGTTFEIWLPVSNETLNG